MYRGSVKLLALGCFIILIAFTLTTVFFLNDHSTGTDAVGRPAHLKRRSIDSSSNDLEEVISQNHNLKSRIEELETRIKSLENELPIKSYPKVKNLSNKDLKRILVTGGAGFVGSHLVDALMLQGHEVIAVDNFFTGHKRNIEHWIGHKNFELIHHDIVSPLFVEVDEIYHLASPASPPHYMKNPVKTLKTNSIGTINMLGLSRRLNSRILIASSSEVYGDPLEHPQKETYFGNVNTMGPRSCYDEGKRVAESLAYAYSKQENISIVVARIFNTYGPRMNVLDGRVVSNFITQALRNESITVYGNGKQTRSFQYVSDLVAGLISLMNSNVSQPINLGNPDEYSILDFAKKIRNHLKSKSEIVFLPEVVDDPKKRRPNIDRAIQLIQWRPTVPLDKGIQLTVDYFQKALSAQNGSDHF